MDPMRTFGEDLEGQIFSFGYDPPDLISPLVGLLDEEVTGHGGEYQHVSEFVFPKSVLFQREVELALRSHDRIASGYASSLVSLEHVAVLTATADFPASVPWIPGYGARKNIHVCLSHMSISAVWLLYPLYIVQAVKYSVVLSDFDYTLGDSTEGIVQCVNAGLAALGLPPSDAERVRPTVGLSLERTYVALTGDENPDNARTFSDAFIEWADRDMAHLAQLYDGTLPFLRALKERGINVGIITSKYKRRISEIFEDHGGIECIDLIVGADSVDREKPDPEGILGAIDHFGVSSDEVVFIGDTDVDAEAAYLAGVDFIGVRTGSNTVKEFKKFPHVAVLDDISKVHEYILT